MKTTRALTVMLKEIQNDYIATPVLQDMSGTQELDLRADKTSFTVSTVKLNQAWSKVKSTHFGKVKPI